jgi:hypothetical protein
MKPFGYDIKDIVGAVMFFMVLGDVVVYFIPYELIRFVVKAFLSLVLLQTATWFRENTHPGFIRDFIKWTQTPDYLYVTRDPETKPLWLEYRREEF